MRHRDKLIYFCLIFMSVLGTASFPFPALGMKVLQTPQFKIYYQSTADLWEFGHRLHLQVFGSASASSSSHPVATKLNFLLARVCRILKIKRSDFPVLKIYLLKNSREVYRRHLLFQPWKRPLFFSYGSLEAFYEAGSKAIFLSVADVHEGILAHELTHFILCTAFSVPPPAHLQESWARYVETHLNLSSR